MQVSPALLQLQQHACLHLPVGIHLRLSLHFQQVEVTHSGTAHAVAVWWQLHMHPQNRDLDISTAPVWAQACPCVRMQ